MSHWSVTAATAILRNRVHVLLLEEVYDGTESTRSPPQSSQVGVEVL